MFRPSVKSVQLDVEKIVAWGWGHKCTGYTVKYKDVTVLLVIKAVTAKGLHVVSFVETYSTEDCFFYLDKAANTTSAPLKWLADKYAN